MFFLLVFPFFWLRVIKSWSWEKIKLEMFSKFKGWKKELTGSITLLILMLVAYFVLVGLLSLIGLNDLEKVSQIVNGEILNGLGLFILTVIIIVFIEEIFFRAFLVKRTGIIIATIIFTLAHIGYNSIAELVGVFVLGLILAYWYKKTNSLTQVYIAHLIYNLFAIAMYIMVMK